MHCKLGAVDKKKEKREDAEAQLKEKEERPTFRWKKQAAVCGCILTVVTIVYFLSGTVKNFQG